MCPFLITPKTSDISYLQPKTYYFEILSILNILIGVKQNQRLLIKIMLILDIGHEAPQGSGGGGPLNTVNFILASYKPSFKKYRLSRNINKRFIATCFFALVWKRVAWLKMDCGFQFSETSISLIFVITILWCFPTSPKWLSFCCKSDKHWLLLAR